VPHTLLLADDSVTIQRVIDLTFADEDIHVVAVSDGDQAIARIEASPPDIILADIGMPGKSGYEVAQYVKQSPRLSHIPVLLLTGAFEPVDQPRAAAVGCEGVMVKPFEPQQVIGRVKELLAKARMAPAQTPDQTTLRGARPETTTQAAQTAPAWASATAVAPLPATTLPSPIPPRSAPGTTFSLASPSASTPAPSILPAPGDHALASPAPPEAAKADLNNYFDRLDEAFANLKSAGPAAGAPHGTRAAEDVDWFINNDADHDAPAAPPERRDVPAPPASVQPDVPLSYASSRRDFDRPPVATRWQPADSPAPIAAVPIPQPPASGDPAAARSGAPATPSALPSIGDAFAALLTAEQTGASPPAALQWPAPRPAAATTVDVVEEVTQRVLDRLSDRVVRETVSGIVSAIAERLVREEIDRIKASIK
jgi:CheY-like chemotaxis protein